MACRSPSCCETRNESQNATGDRRESTVVYRDGRKGRRRITQPRHCYLGLVLLVLLMAVQSYRHGDTSGGQDDSGKDHKLVFRLLDASLSGDVDAGKKLQIELQSQEVSYLQILSLTHQSCPALLYTQLIRTSGAAINPASAVLERRHGGAQRQLRGLSTAALQPAAAHAC